VDIYYKRPLPLTGSYAVQFHRRKKDDGAEERGDNAPGAPLPQDK
jgi:hypothetical protein